MLRRLFLLDKVIKEKILGNNSSKERIFLNSVSHGMKIIKVVLEN